MRATARIAAWAVAGVAVASPTVALGAVAGLVALRHAREQADASAQPAVSLGGELVSVARRRHGKAEAKEVQARLARLIASDARATD